VSHAGNANEAAERQSATKYRKRVMGELDLAPTALRL
jgi:hypothetical protein